MTSENVQNNAPEAAKSAEAGENQSNEAMLAALDAEIAGGESAAVAEIKEEPSAVTPEGEGGEDAEGAHDNQEDEAGNEEDAQPVRRGRKTAREHIAELKAEKAEVKAEKERLAKEVEQLKALVAERLTKKEEPEQDFQPLDPEAQAIIDKKIAKIEQEIEARDFITAIRQEDVARSAKDPQWSQKNDAVIADKALELLISGAASSDAEALEKAKEVIVADMYRLHKAGKPIGDYIEKRAALVARKWPAKKDGAKTYAQGVDVAELDKLRESAGAATNKVAASHSIADGLAGLDAEIAADEQKRRSSGGW